MELLTPPVNPAALSIISLLLCSSAQQTLAPFTQFCTLALAYRGEQQILPLHFLSGVDDAQCSLDLVKFL